MLIELTRTTRLGSVVGVSVGSIISVGNGVGEDVWVGVGVFVRTGVSVGGAVGLGVLVGSGVAVDSGVGVSVEIAVGPCENDTCSGDPLAAVQATNNELITANKVNRGLITHLLKRLHECLIC